MTGAAVGTLIGSIVASLLPGIGIAIHCLKQDHMHIS